MAAFYYAKSFFLTGACFFYLRPSDIRQLVLERNWGVKQGLGVLVSVYALLTFYYSSEFSDF
jgi:hypothetical protein